MSTETSTPGIVGGITADTEMRDVWLIMLAAVGVLVAVGITFR